MVIFSYILKHEKKFLSRQNLKLLGKSANIGNHAHRRSFEFDESAPRVAVSTEYEHSQTLMGHWQQISPGTVILFCRELMGQHADLLF